VFLIVSLGITYRFEVFTSNFSFANVSVLK